MTKPTKVPPFSLQSLRIKEANLIPVCWKSVGCALMTGKPMHESDWGRLFLFLRLILVT